MLVRYYEARQIGDGLTRDAMQALAAQVEAPAGASVVVNPTRALAPGSSRSHSPGAEPCACVDANGEERPTQIIGEINGEAYATMVTGQKVRWVLDLIRGTEFAGYNITSYEITERPPAATASTTLRCRRPGPATSPRPVGAPRTAPRPRHPGPHRQLAPPRRAAPPRVVRHRRDRGLRLVVLHVGRRRGAGRAPSPRRTHHSRTNT